MNKSILLIGNTKSKSTARLINEAENKSIEFDTISSSKIQFLNNKLVVNETESNLKPDLLNYDTYYFRGIGKKDKEMHQIANFLVKQDKRVVEKILADGQLPVDKFVPESKIGVYKVPKSIVTNKDKIRNDILNFSFPVVVKVIESSMGKMVVRVNDIDELIEFVLPLNDDFLLQEYFEIEFDTRVLVIGEKVLGGFNRYKLNSESFLTTVGGGRREVTSLVDKQIVAAIEATRLQGLEIAGVDMFISNNEIYIIEVNSAPQFRVFEKVTGVNVAEEIINYLN